MSQLTAFATDDLKNVYRVLHAHLMEHPELMDSAFFAELQTWLQTLAQVDGVDVTDHRAWDLWLKNEPVPCDERVAKRRRIEP
jgi:hypothetical protein